MTKTTILDSHENLTQWVTFSRGIGRLSVLPEMLSRSLIFLCAVRLLLAPKANWTVVGWGLRPSTDRVRDYTQRHGAPYVALEDGLLRSYGTGDRYPPISVVVDDLGIYYDSRSVSRLEQLLNSDTDLLQGVHTLVDQAMAGIQAMGLSKYNQSPPMSVIQCSADAMTLDASPTVSPDTVEMSAIKRVLVVDQTRGDMSVTAGGANEATFLAMLAAARAENPSAVVYIKTHPEVSSGRKGGYLTEVPADERTVLLRQAVQPASLFEHMDRVYVVSSTMGFEALMAGKAVSCFGVPWYAGWGVTDDRQACPRRQRQHSVKELFAAAYIHYARYLDPLTHRPGHVMHAVQWLSQQVKMAEQMHGKDRQGRVIAVGLARWKAYNLKPMLGLEQAQVNCVADAQALAALRPSPHDTVVCWGATLPVAVAAVVQAAGARGIRMEDGFLRSVGLGSDMVLPQSLVFDSRGIYFDPAGPSDLEHLLNHDVFDEATLVRAARVRAFIVEHGLTKYNLDAPQPLSWPSAGRRVLLVPGQVEDDASIRLGCQSICTNLGLLQAVRASSPDAWIVYKPHPDVMSGNRRGRLHLKKALRFANVVQTEASVIDCITASDEVHTMTSLSGFDALLRGKRVVTYGQPFYAGWGLTVDQCQDGPAFARRTRRLSLDELVAGVLLRYPVYWDWELRGYTQCEAVLERLLAERQTLEKNDKLRRLSHGAFWRLCRKLKVLVLAWTRRL